MTISRAANDSVDLELASDGKVLTHRFVGTGEVIYDHRNHEGLIHTFEGQKGDQSFFCDETAFVTPTDAITEALGQILLAQGLLGVSIEEVMGRLMKIAVKMKNDPEAQIEMEREFAVDRSSGSFLHTSAAD